MLKKYAKLDSSEPPIWLLITASVPVGLCMVVLSLPSINNASADWRRLLCLTLFLTFCIPLLVMQRALLRQHFRWWSTVLILMAFSYLLAIASNSIDFVVSRSLGWIPEQRLDPSRIVRGIDAFWLALVAFCAFHVAVVYYAELKLEQNRAASAMALAREAELRALRYQLHPHFLFNTLNAVSSLVATHRTSEACQMISRLADFLRATIDDNVKHEVALADEIALTDTYIAIERARLGDRLVVRWNIGPDLLNKSVPYLLLQPLVENAIRHGIALRNRPGRLEIFLAEYSETLHVSVYNEGVPKIESMGEEKDAPMLGLQNISNRLAKLYGSLHSFSARNSDDGSYQVEITLPLREHTAAKDLP